jgi:plastocyanin
MLTDAHHPSHVAPASRLFSTALVVGPVLLGAAVLLVAAPRTHAASTVSVEISNFAFQPASVTIQVGDTVTWTNLDSTAHTATDTGSGALFDGAMNQGESFSYTFTQPGTVNYICTLHPEMTGAVIVQGGSQPPATEPPASQLPDGAMASPAARGTMPAVLGWLAAVLGGALLALSLLSAVGGARRRRLAAKK